MPEEQPASGTSRTQTASHRPGRPGRGENSDRVATTARSSSVPGAWTRRRTIAGRRPASSPVSGRARRRGITTSRKVRARRKSPKDGTRRDADSADYRGSVQGQSALVRRIRVPPRSILLMGTACSPAASLRRVCDEAIAAGLGRVAGGAGAGRGALGGRRGEGDHGKEGGRERLGAAVQRQGPDRLE